MSSNYVRSALLLASPFVLTSAHAAFTINLNPNATLAGNAPALAAFKRAAHNWETKFADNITVTIDAGMLGLGNGIIGSTGATTLQAGYTTIRNAMVADGANDGVKDDILKSLPTASQFSYFLPQGKSISSNIVATKANLKALGFTGLDAQFGVSDASINFSTNFSFDYDNSNGVTAGQMDFETVATHEIGHALGFISGVDGLDQGGTTIAMNPLDLFRFRTNELPTTAAQFTSNARWLVPSSNASGNKAFFSDTVNKYQMSTGVNLGDGNQASHWKADEQLGGTQFNIGIMDPTLDFGQVEHISSADLRAFDLIGYDMAPVPEPASMVVLGVGTIALLKRRKKA